MLPPEQMLYGYFEDFGTNYCLVALRPNRINPPYSAIILGAWPTSADCHHLHPDETGRTVQEIRDAHPHLILCENEYEARLTIRRLDLP